MNLKKIVKYGFVLCSICTVLATSMLTSHAVPAGQTGNLPTTTESGQIKIQNAAGTGNTISFKGKTVGDYRINGYTALCNYSAGDGIAGYSGTTTKYILGNSTQRAKIMYYLTPLRASDTPSGLKNDLPSDLKGKSYLWLYQQLSGVADKSGQTSTYYDWLYQEEGTTWFQTNKINTYEDILKATLYYQRGVSGAESRDSSNQYVVVHSLLDYVQHNGFTAPSYSYVSESAAVMLFKFISKYESIIPNVPDSVRAFIVNPKPNTNAQTIISIEYYRGYFKIEKSSANTGATNGNNNYALRGAEFSWYTTKAAAEAAATAVSNGRAVPKGDTYIGYSQTNANGESTTLIQKSGTSTSLYQLGTYYLVETKAPKGYSLNSTVKTLKITTANWNTNSSVKVSFSEPPMLGSLMLSKTDSNSSVTSGNSLYTLSGAEYTVYRDNALQNVYAVITTKNSMATLNNIPYGTYYIKETKAPKGYMLDATVHQFTVNSVGPIASVNSTEPVMYAVSPTLISKRDADTSEPLEGAKFIVEYYDAEFDSHTYRSDFVPKKRWLFKTDSNGNIVLDTAHLATSYTDSNGITVSFSNDSFYLSETNSSIAVLPQGTIKITEVEAPVRYGQDGNQYKYKLDDTPTIRQVVINSSETVEYKTVTLHNEVEGALTKTINGEKTWNDKNNANGNRPNAITVVLIKNVNGVESEAARKTVTAANNWKYQFTNQPIKETVSGTEYTVSYRVYELPVTDYTTSYSGLNINNTEELTSVKVNKVWKDNNDQDGVRPDSVVVRLYANNVDTGKYAMLSERNNWSYTFNELPVMQNKSVVAYSVSEDPITVSEGTYTTTVSPVSGNARSGFSYTVTNTHEPVTTSIVVKKKWNDTDDLDGLRPRSIKFNLKGYIDDNVIYETDTVTMTAYGNATDNENVWAYTFNGLDKYRNGHLIDYVAEELTTIDEYNLDENGVPQTVTASYAIQEDGTYACVLENTHELRTINFDVVKVWDDDDNRDGLRPVSISVYLATVDDNNNKTRYLDASDNTVVGVLQESNGWAYKFTNLPIYDSNRQVINYSVEEIVPSGYTVTYSGDAANGITLTNTHHETTSVMVNKVWNDKNDQDAIRPDSIVVNLLADGTEIDEVELSEGNEWTYIFEDLPVNKNGTAIKYTVTEDPITIPSAFTGSGYTVRYSGLRGTAESGYSITITNTHETEVRSIEVKKTWRDSNDYDGIRPEYVEVLLSVSSPANTGIATKRALVSEDNGWSYTFTNLPKYYKGTLIQYIADEADIAIDASENGYTKTISGNMDAGFTIRNTHRPEKTKVVIKKVWNDSNNSAGARPAIAEFEVIGYQGQVTTVTLSDANNWTYTMQYDRYYDGEAQMPSVKEINIPEGYVARVSQNKSVVSYTTTYEYTWTNTYEPDPTSISVKKIWNDANDYFGDRPEGIILQLFVRNAGSSGTGSPRGSIELSEDNNWQGTFEGSFRSYSNGIEQEYYFVELAARFYDVYDSNWNVIGRKLERYAADQPQFEERYVQKTEGSIVDGYTITNTYHLLKDASVPFKKFWNDDNDRDRIRPSSLDIVLIGYIKDDYNDVTMEVSRRYATVTASNDWEYTFSDLPATCDRALAAQLIDPDDYEEDWEYNDALSWAMVINYRVEEVNVPSGYIYDSYTGSDDNYEYDNDFSLISYNYQEEYNVAYYGHDPLAFGLINTHTPEVTGVKVSKIWSDDNNRDGVRPASLTVNLFADNVQVNSVALNDNNGWSYTFSDLPVYDNGNEIAYTVTETAFTTPSGFTDYVALPIEAEGNKDDGWIFTFTNTYEPKTTHITAVKRWQDNKNRYGFRPSSILIILKADGVAVQTYSMTVSDADAALSTSSIDAWKYVFDNLPKYNNGVEIQYTVEEKLVGESESLYLNTRTQTSTDSGGCKTYTFTNRNKDASLVIQKLSQLGYPLIGSEFDLYFADGTPCLVTSGNVGTYYYLPNNESGTNRITISGSTTIYNLPPNAVVILREVISPNGFSAYANDITVDIKQIILDYNVEESRTGTYTLPAIIVNDYRTIMPATGGVGDYAIYILAGLALIGAIIFYIIKKKKGCKL